VLYYADFSIVVKKGNEYSFERSKEYGTVRRVINKIRIDLAICNKFFFTTSISPTKVYAKSYETEPPELDSGHPGLHFTPLPGGIFLTDFFNNVFRATRSKTTPLPAALNKARGIDTMYCFY
jgi:hypothetical protein